MPLNPPPTIELGLGLIVQGLLRSDMTRAAEVTYALNVAGVPSVAVAQDAVDDFSNNFQATWGTVLDTDVTMLAPTIKLGDGSTTPFEAVSAVPVALGANITAVVTPNVAVLMKKTSGLGGRQNRGRTYMPFALDANVVNENGTIPAVNVASYTSLGMAMLAQLTLDGEPMVIAHRVFNVPLAPHYVTAIHTGPLVTAYNCESTIATQRRRLGR